MKLEEYVPASASCPGLDKLNIFEVENLTDIVRFIPRVRNQELMIKGTMVVYKKDEWPVAYIREPIKKDETIKLMDEHQVREIFKNKIKADNDNLHSLEWQLSWDKGDKAAYLSGYFTAEELEAFAWWMNKNG